TIDMLSTSIGSCTRRRWRNVWRQLAVRLRQSRSIFVFEFIRCPSLSVVEEEKRDKAGQNPKHRAQNSEPERDVPVRAGHGRGIARECFCKSCHEIYSCIVRTTRKRTLPLCICSYASDTRLSGYFSIIGWTPLKAMNSNVS